MKLIVFLNHEETRHYATHRWMTTNLLAAFGEFLDSNRFKSCLKLVDERVKWTDLTLALWRYKEQLAYNENNVKILKYLFKKLRLKYAAVRMHRSRKSDSPRLNFLTSCDYILGEEAENADIMCRSFTVGAYEITKDIEIAIDEVYEFFFGDIHFQSFDRNIGYKSSLYARDG